MPYEFTCEQCGGLVGSYQRNRRYRARCPRCRFWHRVDQRGSDECWPWAGPIDHDGYGQTGLGHTRDVARAHRAAWTFTHGEIPDRMQALHTCDNPPCCNPAHLFLGTNADNMADRNAKDRVCRASGEERWSSKLNDAAVREIRARFAAGGITQQALADEYGVTHSNISAVILRKTWKHID